MVELFFGKQFNYLLFLFIFILLSNINNQKNIVSFSDDSDTILKNKFEKEIKKQIKLLDDTTYYKKNFLNGEIEFYNDTFFNSKVNHVIVTFTFNKENIIGKYFQVYKKDGNKIGKYIDDEKLCYYNHKIYDYNHDSINDFSIKWSYCSGKCNGNIFSVYLYDIKLDTFYYKTELDYNTGLYIDTINNSIITEDRCYSVWKKFIWNKFELKQIEEIRFDNELTYYIKNNSNDCIRSHFVISDSSKILIGKKQTCKLPEDWYSYILK